MKKPINASAEVNALNNPHRRRHRDGSVIKTAAEKIRTVTEHGQVVNKALRLYTRGQRTK